MTPPSHEFLAAPLWLVTALHILTLALHFMAMNFLLGGAIIVAQAAIRKRDDNPLLARLPRLFPTAMAATVTLGVAPLLFVQLVYHRQLYSAAIVSGWFWLFVIPAAILAYYTFYRASFRAARGQVTRFGWLIPLAGLTYISFLYSSIFTMAERPDQMHALYASNQSGWLFNPALGDYGFRWLHMVLGAVAVGGFFAGWLGRHDPRSFATGRAFFMGGMIASGLAGVAWLLALKPWLAVFRTSPAVSVLAIGVILSAGSIYYFLDRAFGRSGILLFGSMLAMVYTRHEMRLIRLAPHFDPAALPVNPQWSPLALFGVCFVIAAGVLVWMIRAFFGSRTTSA